MLCYATRVWVPKPTDDWGLWTWEMPCFFLVNNVDKKNQEKKDCLKNKGASTYPSFKVYMTCCVCSCDCSYVWVHMHACLGARGHLPVSFLRSCPPDFLKLVWKSSSGLSDWLEIPGVPCVFLCSAGLTGMCYHAQIFFFLKKSLGI